jgi:hypothetical protein
MMRRRGRVAAIAVLCGVTLASMSAWGVETRVTVRVVSKDAKFVGSSMGGARVTIKDADTGELLARGVTAGSTGNTGLLMKEPLTRRTPRSDDNSAKFTATLDIDAPVRVEISADGPLAQRQAAGSASLTQWILPGKDIVAGDAILLELPGFVVDVLAPPAHIRAGAAPLEVPVRVNVTMMCGCPVEPGGLWDSDTFEIRAVVTRDGEAVVEVPLTFAGTTSQFECTVNADKPGTYDVTVYAFDASNGNTGLDRTTFIVQ